MQELRTTFEGNVPPAANSSIGGTELWLAPAWTMLPLARRLCRVRNPINEVVAQLTSDQFAVLTACEGCKTIDEHGAGVRQKLGVPDHDWPVIREWLGKFATLGLLVSLGELIKRLDPTSDRLPAPFAGVFIRTRDRPPLLKRALGSAAAIEQHNAARHRYHVLDDSRDPDAIARNRDAVAGSGLDIAHHVLSDEHALVRALLSEFPSARDAIRWLLGKPAAGEATYGRPVNFALLLSAGRRLLMLDDDALLDPRRAPIAAGGFAISSARDELFCYRSEAELEAACARADIDPIAAHLQVLGAPVGRVWNESVRDVSGPHVVELSGDDASRFVPDARVLMTQNHAIGDPGSALFPYHLLALPAASRERMLCTPDLCATAFCERHDWRGQARARMTPHRTLTFTTLAGLDNSVLLPAAARANRNEDLLLGELIRHVHRGAWAFDLPWGLPHRRVPTKTWLDASASFPQEPLHFLMDVLEQRAPAIVGELPADRMRTLAGMLVDIGTTSDGKLDVLLEQQAADTASRVRYAIERDLEDAAVPAWWKQELKRWLGSPTIATSPEALRARCASPTVVRDLALQYGRALAHWPELWAWASEWNR